MRKLRLREGTERSWGLNLSYHNPVGYYWWRKQRGARKEYHPRQTIILCCWWCVKGAFCKDEAFPTFPGDRVCLKMQVPRSCSRPTETEPWRWVSGTFTCNKLPPWFYRYSSLTTEIGNWDAGHLGLRVSPPSTVREKIQPFFPGWCKSSVHHPLLHPLIFEQTSTFPSWIVSKSYFSQALSARESLTTGLTMGLFSLFIKWKCQCWRPVEMVA